MGVNAVVLGWYGIQADRPRELWLAAGCLGASLSVALIWRGFSKLHNENERDRATLRREALALRDIIGSKEPE